MCVCVYMCVYISDGDNGKEKATIQTIAQDDHYIIGS